jgi:hypothetical protein
VTVIRRFTSRTLTTTNCGPNGSRPTPGCGRHRPSRTSVRRGASSWPKH